MEATRVTKRTVQPDGSFIEETTEPLASVELTLDSKGSVKPVVKCYGLTVEDAGIKARAEMEKNLTWAANKGEAK